MDLHHLIASNVYQSYYVLSLLLLIENAFVDEIPMTIKFDFLYILLGPMYDLKIQCIEMSHHL